MSHCFVALIHPDGRPSLICDYDSSGDDPRPKIYESFADAERAMDENRAAQAWGYEIFPWPHRQYPTTDNAGGQS